MKYVVTEKEAGKRLDQFLAERTDLSRSKIAKFIQMDKVLCNGKKDVKPSLVLKLDDKVYFRKPKWIDNSSRLKAEEIPLNIVYEDEYFLIVNKPAGIVVHPGVANREGTLLNALLGYLNKQKKKAKVVLRPILVHRLDKDTSGLLVVAKNDNAYAPLAKLFEKRKIKKKYIALVAGRLKPETGTIEAPLKRHVQERLKMAVSDHPKAKLAVTHYRVKKYVDQYTLLELELVTGRTHQIRVHLSAIKFPVLGDETYGNKTENKKLAKLGLTRQFLHAYSLEFVHPWTENKVKFKAELPGELEGVLGQLKIKN